MSSTPISSTPQVMEDSAHTPMLEQVPGAMPAPRQVLANGAKPNIDRQGETLRGAVVVVESRLQEGVELLCGYRGGAILHVYDALHKAQDRSGQVLVRHEQGAVHAAEGFARATGRVGVAMVTS